MTAPDLAARLAAVQDAIRALLDSTSRAEIVTLRGHKDVFRLVPEPVLDALMAAVFDDLPDLKPREQVATIVRLLPGYRDQPSDVVRRVVAVLLGYRDALADLALGEGSAEARRIVAIFDALGE